MVNRTIGGLGAEDPVTKLGRRITELERELKEVRAGRSLEAASIGDGGINLNGGAVRVLDDNGRTVGLVGKTTSGDTGFFVFRPDGTPSFYAWTDPEGFVALFDEQGNYVVTEDTTSGQGLARPYVPFGSFVDNSVPTATTSGTAWANLQVCSGYKQHPGLILRIIGRSVGVTGEIRLVDDASNQIGATQSFTAGQFEYRDIIGAVVGAHMAPLNLTLQARVLTGTGSIGVRGYNPLGVESAAID